MSFIPYLLVALVLFGCYALIVRLLLSNVQRSSEALAEEGRRELQRLLAEYRKHHDTKG